MPPLRLCPNLTNLPGEPSSGGDPQDWQRLGNCRDGRTFEPFLERLVHDNNSVRAGAAEALGKLGDRRACGPLIKALEHRDLDFRRAAPEALGSLSDPAAVDPLIHALADGEKSARRPTAKALGELGDALAVEALIKKMTAGECGQRNICIAAAEALGKLGDTRAVEPLIRWLPRRDIRDHPVSKVEKRRGCAAAEVLGKLRDPRAAEPLVHAALDAGYRGDVGGVCEAAAEALRRLGDKHAVKPLIRGLSGWNLRVRQMAARLVREIALRNPECFRGKWETVSLMIRTPHTERYHCKQWFGEDLDGSYATGWTRVHADTGIGLDFPALLSGSAPNHTPQMIAHK